MFSSLSVRHAALLGLAAALFGLNPRPVYAVITYVDATDGPSGNTTLLDGSVWETTVFATGPVDDLWSKRAFANDATIFEASIQTGFTTGGPTEDAHGLKTTITGLVPGAEYSIFGYFWSTTGTGDWRLEGTLDFADFNDNGTPGTINDDFLPGIPAVSFTRQAGNLDATQASPANAARFDSAVLVTESNRVMYEAVLGQTTANGSGEIDVYIDDWENDLNIRTWYDGVGYEIAGSPTLTINRETGELVYESGIAKNILGYKIESPAGTLDQSAWTSITEYYDDSATGPNAGLIDADDSWTILTSPTSDSDLSEAELEFAGANDGGILPSNTPISFGNVWKKYTTEDITMEILLNDAEGTIETVEVVFSGNNDSSYLVGDFDFDGDIDPDDAEIFIGSLFDTISGSVVDAYALGDLDGDIDVDYDDLVAYREIYDLANGTGALQAAFLSGNQVPEPSSVVVAIFGLLLALGLTHRQRHCRGLNRAFVRAGMMSSVATLSVWMATTASAQITYVDATDGAGGNTTLLDGSQWDVVVATGITPADNLWSRREFANGNTIYEAGVTTDFNSGGFENAPMLKTTIAGLQPGKMYNVFGYFWSGSDWRLEATLDPSDINDMGTPGDTSDDILDEAEGITFTRLAGEPNSTQAFPSEVGDFLNSVEVTNGSQLMYQAPLGEIAADPSGNIDIYIDEWDNTANFRAWYDGVGYSPVLDVVLEVNTTTGMTTLKNNSGELVDLTYYKITSSNNELNVGGWNTLDMQNLDAVDGDDPDTIAGDSVLEGWDIAGGSNAGLLSEVNFLNSSQMGVTGSFSLGQAFMPGVTDGVAFEYETQSGLRVGTVEFVTGVSLPGDYDGNGTVEVADYTAWKLAFGQSGASLPEDGNGDGVVDAADYVIWRNNLGATSTPPGSLVSGNAQVPEPSALLLLGIAIPVWFLSRSR